LPNPLISAIYLTHEIAVNIAPVTMPGNCLPQLCKPLPVSGE